MNQGIYDQLPAALLPWFARNRRSLPWRENNDPYRVWLSEIMLQQTRVEAVKGYYSRFLQTIPDVQCLANADDELLHKLWEGLGYYSRVRNLKKAAQVIVSQFGGQFPSRYEDVLSLPGIGEYTAGAICSISFQQKKAAVDGNVLRVISRLTADAAPVDTPAYKKQVQTQLERVYPEDAGAFTQALMELGATVCGPNWTPHCGQCPCRHFCKAAAAGEAERYPVKTPKKPRKVEEITVFVLSCGDEYALQKRPSEGLLADLWQFPNTSGRLDLSAALAYLEARGVGVRDVRMQVEKKHIFTHIEWKMTGFYLETAQKDPQFVWMHKTKIKEAAALPTAFRQFWEDIENV